MTNTTKFDPPKDSIETCMMKTLVSQQVLLSFRRDHTVVVSKLATKCSLLVLTKKVTNAECTSLLIMV